MRRAAMALAIVTLIAVAARANEMRVEERSLQMNDFATITVTLEGSFASNDFVEIPLQNLALVGDPWVSSEFAWINGNVVRRKVFRYRARPIAPGPARVGPVELHAEDGQVDRLNAIAVDVLPDRAAGSNDAEQVLRELLATGRDPFFVVAEVDKTSVFAGEPVIITWVMYNAALVQQWDVVNVPKLPDFWTEDLTRNETAERVYIGDAMVQRLPIRRIALYPLRSGRLRVDGMTLAGAIMRRRRAGPFAMFEGDMVESTFTSAPVFLDVKPLPPGPPVDAVGDFTLTCDSPLQKGGGPVVQRVTLSGIGNARAATPPRFEKSVDGVVQFNGGEVTVARDEGSGEMTRRWQVLIFPASAGPLEIPALTMRVFAPHAGVRHDLRCASSILDVVATQPPAPLHAPPADTAMPRPIPWPWIAGGAALLLALLLAIPRVLRMRAVGREARAIVHNATPAEIRARMEGRVAIDLREASDRGDAWRALRSILDAAEKERDIAVNADREIERRVRDVLRQS
jgi:hypothetical protein